MCTQQAGAALRPNTNAQTHTQNTHTFVSAGSQHRTVVELVEHTVRLSLLAQDTTEQLRQEVEGG